MSISGFLHRVVALLWRPELAWREIRAAELGAWRQLIVHVLVLAAIGPMALALGLMVFGTPPALPAQSTPLAPDSPMGMAIAQSYGSMVSTFSAPSRPIAIGPALAVAAISYLSFVAAFVAFAVIYWFLAPACAGRRTPLGAAQLAAFGMTPIGISALGLCHPSFSLLLAVGLIHSAVLTNAGAPIVLHTPKGEGAMLIVLAVIVFQVAAPLAGYFVGTVF